jgi:L-threonylcarbamoyladenylate synthase
LTLILPRVPGVAEAAAGGNPTIGLRCPSHPVARAVLNALLDKSLPLCVWGLAAPSANQFGRVSPTTAAHVQGEFGDDLLILDGGACHVGIESTIIDCSRGQPVLLRPGAITPQQVQAVCGLRILLKDELEALDAPAPKASGTLESHYAPRARVRLMDAQHMQAALCDAGAGLAVWHRNPIVLPAAGCLSRRMPADPVLAARQLFAVLRAFDQQGATQIWIEAPPEAVEWDGVRDRLQRAAAS